jgi:predicted RNA-binding Zn-ribbon protein involved in translation (DUF1610 family)
MSPDEIPGIPLKFLNGSERKKCPDCGDYFNMAKLKLKNGIIYKLCPNCGYKLDEYDYKKMVILAAKRGK